jgi:hypothetical protein
MNRAAGGAVNFARGEMLAGCKGNRGLDSELELRFHPAASISGGPVVG